MNHSLPCLETDWSESVRGIQKTAMSHKNWDARDRLNGAIRSGPPGNIAIFHVNRGDSVPVHKELSGANRFAAAHGASMLGIRIDIRNCAALKVTVADIKVPVVAQNGRPTGNEITA